MNNAALTAAETFRSLLQSIICERYLDRDAALCAIDEAYAAGAVTQYEARKLEAAAEKHYG